MKVITTIHTAKKAWEILKKANLHHFLDAGVLAALATLDSLEIKMSDIISSLLESGLLVQLLETITNSEYYIDDDGKKVNWEQVDIDIPKELISAFFTKVLSAFPMLRPS